MCLLQNHTYIEETQLEENIYLLCARLPSACSYLLNLFFMSKHVLVLVQDDPLISSSFGDLILIAAVHYLHHSNTNTT